MCIFFGRDQSLKRNMSKKKKKITLPFTYHLHEIWFYRLNIFDPLDPHGLINFTSYQYNLLNVALHISGCLKCIHQELLPENQHRY